jgi:hypothetical protein
MGRTWWRKSAGTAREGRKRDEHDLRTSRTSVAAIMPSVIHSRLLTHTHVSNKALPEQRESSEQRVSGVMHDVAIGNTRQRGLSILLVHLDTALLESYISCTFRHSAQCCMCGRIRRWHVGAGSVDSTVWCRVCAACVSQSCGCPVRLLLALAWQMDVNKHLVSVAALYGWRGGTTALTAPLRLPFVGDGMGLMA